MGPPSASTRWLLAAAGILVAITVAGLVLGGGQRADLDEDGPPAAVRDFLTAFEERDVEGMRAALAADRRDACSDEEIRRATRGGTGTDTRAVLVDTEVSDGHAEVEVRLTEHHGEPPFGGGYTHTEIFEVVREDGDWVVTRMPWSYRACPGWTS